MAPLLLELKEQPSIQSLVCVTGQHREMLDPVLSLFGIAADYDLRLMRENQPLNGLMARAIQSIDDILVETRPDRVLVQGDTTSALAAAQAAYHRGIPVAHVEAGLRTHALNSPWPEEGNRRIIDLLSDLLLAPTLAARRNLEREQLKGQIFVTGNSGIDALRLGCIRLEQDAQAREQADAQLPLPVPGARTLLVTCHRRESFGRGLRNLCQALRKLTRRGDVQIVYPVHLNPAVRKPVERALAGLPNLHLLPPLEFLPFLRLLQKADVVLTDSGGVQEEAPALGKAVLVMRDLSERTEAIEARAARLVGTSAARIVDEVTMLLDAAEMPHIPFASSPYGDGFASRRIVDALLGRPVDEFGARHSEPAPIALFR